MSQEDFQSRTSNTKSRFRATLHIAMGILYLLLSGIMFTAQKFGTVELGKGMSYGLGTLLVVYGLFRIWRGIQDLRTGGTE